MHVCVQLSQQISVHVLCICIYKSVMKKHTLLCPLLSINHLLIIDTIPPLINELWGGRRRMGEREE